MFDLIGNPAIEEVVLPSGDYLIPDGWTMKGLSGKRIISDGLVRFIGRFIVEQCDDVLFANCSFRAPLSHIGRWNELSYDAVDVFKCNQVSFVACSILGGCDETIAIKESTSCSIDNSIIGCCFAVPRRNGKTHSMAMLVECDGFELTNSVITSADRRKPQVQEWQDPECRMIIAGNRIDGGRTMTIGLKPQWSFRCDIVDNVIHRTGKTKSADVEIVNGSTGHCDIFTRGNFVAGSSSPISIEDDQDLRVSRTGFSSRAYSASLTQSLFDAGPENRDSWDHFVLSNFGSGSTWASESHLPDLAIR